jgi:hypothetical protein
MFGASKPNQNKPEGSNPNVSAYSQYRLPPSAAPTKMENIMQYTQATLPPTAEAKGDENVAAGGRGFGRFKGSLVPISTIMGKIPQLNDPQVGTAFGVPLNQQNNGTTVRPAATALLTIDSEDRFPTQYNRRNLLTSTLTTSTLKYNWNPYDYQIIKNEALMNGFFTRVGVTEIVFPTAALPNINPKTDTINVVYQPNDSLLSATAAFRLTDGFYTPNRLASTMTSAVRSLYPGLSSFQMQYGVGNVPNFAYTTSNTIPILFAPNPENIPAYPYSAQTRQLYDLLGMTYQNNSVFTSSVTFTSITNCQDSRYYDVVCSQLTLNQAVKDSSSQQIVRDSLCRIYIADGNPQNTVQPSDPAYTPPGTAPTTIYRNFTLPKQIQWLPNQSIQGNITIQVYDDDGNLLVPVKPGYGLDWSMTLQASEN